MTKTTVNKIIKPFKTTWHEIYLIISKPAHTWIALLTVFFAFWSPVISIVLCACYLVDQTQEYKQIKDTCYQDIREYIIAACAGLTVILFLRVFNPWGIYSLIINYLQSDR